MKSLFRKAVNPHTSNCVLKVSEYPFKQNKNVKKHDSAIITDFYNISLNLLRSTFSNILNLPVLRSPNM